MYIFLKPLQEYGRQGCGPIPIKGGLPLLIRRNGQFPGLLFRTQPGRDLPCFRHLDAELAQFFPGENHTAVAFAVFQAADRPLSVLLTNGSPAFYPGGA